MGAGLPDQGLLPTSSWALAQVPFLGTGSDSSRCLHVTEEEGQVSGVLSGAPQVNPRPRRPCHLPDQWQDLPGR